MKSQVAAIFSSSRWQFTFVYCQGSNCSELPPLPKTPHGVVLN